MPWGDRTGPMGSGPMTGRAAGWCAGYGVPGYANPLRGRGWGMGFGRGRGMGRGRGFGRWTGGWGWPGYMAWPYWPAERFGAPNPKLERAMLEEELEWLEERKKRLQERMEQLAGTESAED